MQNSVTMTAVRLMLPVLLCTLSLVARAGDYEDLGEFERGSVDQALKRLKLEIDPAPAGKTIREIHIANLDVFSERDGFLHWFNIFHVTSREEIVRRELLLKNGAIWDSERVDETVRRLKDPMLTNVAVVLPIKSGVPGRVDVLVVTRDVWSLRLNSNFQLQEDQLTLLTISLAENNLAGLRKKMALTFNMTQGSYDLGPRYFDGNVAGTHLTAGGAAAVIFNRKTGDYEGTASSLSVGYPLWSLSESTGGGIQFAHYDGVSRRYQGTSLLPYDLRSTAQVEAIPYEYRYRSFGITTHAVHSIGHRVKHRFRYGYEFAMTSARALDKHFSDPTQRTLFEREILEPRTERSSGIWAGYKLFTPRWGTYRDLKTYDLREDYLLGPELNLTIVAALKGLGSDTNHQRLSVGAAWSIDPGLHSYLRLSGGWYGRIEHGELIDNRVSGGLFAASPSVWGVFRVVGRADLQVRLKDSRNGFYSLGGESGLRGYAIGQFTGRHRFRSNLELRSTPVGIRSLRFGAVAFWDQGHTADRLEDLDLHHDVGVGIRLLIPQVNTRVLRADWSFPLQGVAPGWPGRLSVGFFQAF